MFFLHRSRGGHHPHRPIISITNTVLWEQTSKGTARWPHPTAPVPLSPTAIRCANKFSEEYYDKDKK